MTAATAAIRAQRRAAAPKAGAPAAAPQRAPDAAGGGAGHMAAPAFQAAPAIGLPTQAAAALPVQAKVAVGDPGDPWEREADGAATAVVEGGPMPQLSPVPKGPGGSGGGSGPMAAGVLGGPTIGLQPMVQAACPECAAKQGQAAHAPMAAGEAPVQRASAAPDAPVQPAAAELPVQPKAARQASTGAGAPIGPRRAAQGESAIRNPSPGRPMHAGTRAAIEPRLGADLGAVRVHDNPSDRRAGAALGARAFTHGNHIWLGPGEGQTDLGLMAHESAHVVQQGAAGPLGAGAAQGVGGAPGSLQAAPLGPSGRGGGAPAAGSAAPLPSAPAGVAPVALAPSPPAGGGGAPAAAGPAAPTGPAAAAGAARPLADGGGAGGAGPALLMPEPPTDLSAADRERLGAVQGQAGAAAAVTEAMPSPDATVAEARTAVQEPQAETAARAAGELTATLGERAAPSPEIEALCGRIRDAIRSRRPPDEESLVQFDPRAAAQSAGDEMTASVEGDAQRVQGDYGQLEEAPAGTPQQEAQPLETPPAQVETPPVAAGQAVPDPVPAQNVSLDADLAAQQQQIEGAGMASEPAALIQDPANPVVQAREAQGELGEVAQRAPQEVLAEQTAVREQARGEMQGLQQQALQALSASRGATVDQVAGGMVNLGTTEEEMRANAGSEAQRIFSAAQTQVTNLLNPLPQTAMRRWETGIAVLSTRVEQQSTDFNNWKRARYEGIGGTALEVVEYFTGLPDWAIDWLNSIETRFGDDVCDLIRDISTEVNTVIATCEELIDNANRQIADLFARLPASLQDWAAGQQAGFNTQLEGLRARATSARDDFNRQLSQQASQAVQQVRESIHAMRQEAQGLIGQIADAIGRFADDPARFIINGLLKLVGISPAAFWGLVDRIGQVINDIAEDPLNFANNLAAALGQGFQRFFDNFGTHIQGGFFEWLFSGLGSVGVQIPSDFSLGSLITFFLQLMGITWARIRGILARHIGEENVALLEKAYELIATLMERGVDGIYEMIKEQLNPRAILDAVLSAAVDFLIGALIRAVTPRVIAMFNPAGAIVQAIEVIYRILAWVFQNAARIFSLVETVVNGAAQLIAGNTSAMAGAVEGALARIIAPVIDFLAGFLGLGDLPDRIADTIRGFQEMVLGVIDRVIGWLAERAKALLRALAGEAEPDERSEEEKQADLESGLSEADALLIDQQTPIGTLDDGLAAIKTRYRMSSLVFVVVDVNMATGIENVQVVGQVNPAGSKPPKPHNLKELVASLNPINSKYAGQTVTIASGPLSGTSVTFNTMGFPDFSPFAIASVPIQMRGNRSYRVPDGDFGNANEAAGYARNGGEPDGHTWHHHQDRRTMQLVPTAIHDAFRHSGGVWVIGELGER